MTDISVDNPSTDHSSTETQRVFANEESGGQTVQTYRGDSSDEIDPRDLVRDPSLNEIRWYYRRTFASKLVDKPVEDAFKNSFDFEETDSGGMSPEEARRVLDDSEYIQNFMLADKKARRDGFALLYLGYEDSSSGPEESPADADNVTDVTFTKVYTIDDMTGQDENAVRDALEGDYEDDEWELRSETGIVVNTNPTSSEYRDPIGYVVGNESNGQFVHPDRVQHLVWNPEVDGDYNNQHVHRFHHGHDGRSTLGQWEGDSVLINSYDLMKGLAKGNWSVMQTLYRNAANMYAVWMPRDADEEEWEDAQGNLTNLNAKSELQFPGGPPGSTEGGDHYDIEQFESGNQLEPREYFDVIFDQLCAGQEMTKSVLFGTQTGTVSGSETDIKNYFNKVQRYRKTRAKNYILNFLRQRKMHVDGRAGDSVSISLEINWGPLFDMGAEEKINALARLSEGMNAAVNGFLLTPDEARSVLKEDWAIDIDSDVLQDLGEGEGQDPDLTEAQREWLEDINISQVGRDPDKSSGGREQGGGGGMEEGMTTSQENPTTDELVDSIAEKVATRLENDSE